MGEEVIVPIGVCVILPVAIVFIVYFYGSKVSAGKMTLLAKAIESGVDIDPKALMDAINKKKQSERTIKAGLIRRLTFGIALLILGIAAFVMAAFEVFTFEEIGIAGAVCCAAGASMTIAYFIGKNMLRPEIEAETRIMEEKAAERANGIVKE